VKTPVAKGTFYMAHLKYHEVVSLCPHCTERIVTKIACEGAPDIKEIAPSAFTNSDYAAALKVYDEWHESTCESDMLPFRGWLSQRLN
jgi:hypothetical protein